MASIRVLFIHGLESGTHGFKAQYLAEHFCCRCVAMPKSGSAVRSSGDFEECVGLQERALDEFKPDVVVASSFGAAVCLELVGRGRWGGPCVLLAQAFTLLRPDAPPPRLLPDVPYCLVHGTKDAVVPIEHSRALRATGSPGLVRLVEPDDTHGLRTVLGVRASHAQATPLPDHLQLRALVRDVASAWAAAAAAPQAAKL
jgi:hypothetical protein